MENKVLGEWEKKFFPSLLVGTFELNENFRAV